MTPGFVHVPFNDLEVLERTIDRETCGVLVEPIQGEGGINVPSEGYLTGVRSLCDKHGLALIFDEVWTGCGRTGKFFAHQHKDGAAGRRGWGEAGHHDAGQGDWRRHADGLHVRGAGEGGLAQARDARVHAGRESDLRGGVDGGDGDAGEGGPAGRGAEAGEDGDAADSRFQGRGSAGRGGARIKEVRGRGLFIGVELAIPDGGPVVQAALARGLILNATSKNVLRICPALTIGEKLLERGLDLLEEALEAG